MKLRPHHILCIQKFTGHGYDERFTKHMTSVVSTLNSARDTFITLVQGCDELCSMCPNNADGECTSLEKVALMDSRVLDACSLTYEDNAQWVDLSRRAQERIFKTEEFNNICSCCQWFELCRRTEESND